MKGRGKGGFSRSILLGFLLCLSWPVLGDSLIGLNYSVLGFTKKAKGTYRLNNGSYIEMKQIEESITATGPGLSLGFAYRPGSAGFYISPFFASGATSIATSGLSSATYTLFGFSEEQSNQLSSRQSNIVNVNYSVFGSHFWMQYHFPNRFRTRTLYAKILQKGLSIINPWIGLGPTLLSVKRIYHISAIDQYAQVKSTDILLGIYFGLQISLQNIYKKIPPFFVLMHLGFYSNLTPEEEDSPNDDLLAIEESGLVVQVGVSFLFE